MVKATYAGETEHNNTKGLLFNLAFTGNYGVNGVGDPVDLSPGAIADPCLAYNEPLCYPAKTVGVLNAAVGGSTIALKPNAVPTLQNLGVIMYEPGGAEKATAAAYTAAELAGIVEIVVFMPLQ